MWYYVQWDLTQFEKGRGILTQATPWTDLEDVIPREVSQSWKPYDFTYKRYLK